MPPWGLATSLSARQWPGHLEHEDVLALVRGEDTLGAQRILASLLAPAERVWALLHYEFLSDAQLRLLACEFAASCLFCWSQVRPGDARPARALRVGENYARGRVGHGRAARSSAQAEQAAWSLSELASNLVARCWRGDFAPGEVPEVRLHSNHLRAATAAARAAASCCALGPSPRLAWECAQASARALHFHGLACGECARCAGERAYLWQLERIAVRLQLLPEPAQEEHAHD